MKNILTYLLWFMAALFLWFSCWLPNVGGGSGKFWCVFILFLGSLVFITNYSVLLLRDHLFYFVVVLFSYLFLSLLWSESPSETFRGIKDMVFPYSIVLLFNLNFNKKNGLEVLLKIYLAIAVLASLKTIFNGAGGAGTDQRLTIEDVGVNVNVVALFATYALLICLYLAKQRKLYLLAAPVLVYAIAISGCRKSIGMLLISFLVFVLFKFLKERNSKSVRNLFIYSFYLLVALLMFLYLPVFSVTRDRITRSFSAREKEGSAEDRKLLYQIGYSVFKEHPIVGVGYGCVKYHIVGSGAGYLHSNYAQLAADMGIVGIVIWYGFSLYYLWRFLSYYFSRSHLPNEELALLMITFILSDLFRDTGNVSICDYFAIINFLFYSLCLHMVIIEEACIKKLQNNKYS